MQPKTTRAFRTISEAGEELGLQPHVLRFWESKFSEINPIKRGGGRRFYRPEDIELLRGIKTLLHIEKHPIKDVQKLIKKSGAARVVELGRSVEKAANERDITDTTLVPDRITKTEIVIDEAQSARPSIEPTAPTKPPVTLEKPSQTAYVPPIFQSHSDAHSDQIVDKIEDDPQPHAAKDGKGEGEAIETFEPIRNSGTPDHTAPIEGNDNRAVDVALEPVIHADDQALRHSLARLEALRDRWRKFGGE